MTVEDVVRILQSPPVIRLCLPSTLPLEFFQQGLHFQREVHIPITGHRLCLLDDNVLASDLYHIPLDVDGPFLPVDVAPLQATALATTHSGCDEDVYKRQVRF